MYLFYKRINRKYEECENCGKTGVKLVFIQVRENTISEINGLGYPA